ncbi:MAG TPA: HK97 family phage prohead protease [Candidatus Dormibacteraeota bacterium]|nr:HK97 family phage prohead protease [Candidatus Dormibacteraeota bacterium]
MIERRFATANLEFRDDTSDKTSPGTIVGYPVRWGTISHDLGGFRERVAMGAFDGTLRSDQDVRALFNHNPDMVLGRRKNKTLALRNDASGLKMACLLPDTSLGRDLAQLVKRGDIGKMSFAFQCESEDWNDQSDPEDPSAKIPVRTIRAAKLFDVSAVTSPAYESTSLQMSSVADGTSPLYGISSMPSGAMRQFFPEGVPVEVRAHVLRSVPRDGRAAERRRRILDFVL